MPLSSNQRIPALDGLRGVAILLVAVYHFTKFVPTSGVGALYADAARAGWVGVDLFFVLSGFLITGILDDSRGAPGYFRSFFARRTLRIFPLYYVAMIVVTFVLPLFPHIGPPVPGHPLYLRIGEPAPRHAFYLWIYATNIVQAFSNHWLWDDRTAGVTHFWSLAVEEHFYLVWPMVIGFLSRRKAMLVCLGCIMTAPLIRLGFYLSHLSPIGPYVFTGCRMDALAMGGLLALALRSSWGPALLARREIMAGLLWLNVILIGAVFTLSRSTHWHPGPTQTAGYSLIAACFGCLVFLLATAPRQHPVARCFSARWLQFFGKYSYGMYVWHAMIAEWIMRTAPWLQEHNRLISPLIGQFIQVSVGLAASFAMAFLSFQLIEKHFLRLKRFFDYKVVPVLGDDERASDRSTGANPRPIGLRAG